VFDIRVQSRIFGPNRDEVTGGWRKLYNEELRDWYSSPNTIRRFKPRIMQHVALIDKNECKQGFSVRVARNEITCEA
jgi:hypothetical protein